MIRKKAFTVPTLRIVLLTLCLTLTLSAVAFAERPEISADRQSFDVAAMRYLLDGNVTVRFSERTITADHAQVSLLTMEVWAQDHIRLVEGDILFTGKTLYVKGSEHTAYLENGVDFTRSAIAIRADEATFNWDTKIAEFTGRVRLTQENTTENFSRVRYHVVTGEVVSTE